MSKDQPQAFPGIRIGVNPFSGADTQYYFTGMTLRDYFAAKAMQGLAAVCDECQHDDGFDDEPPKPLTKDPITTPAK